MKKLIFTALLLTLTSAISASAGFAQSAPTVTPYVCEQDGDYDGQALSTWVTATVLKRTALKSSAKTDRALAFAGGLFGNFNNSGKFSSMSFSIKGTPDPIYGPWVYVQIIQDGSTQTYAKPATAGTIGSTSKDGFTTVSFTANQMGIPPQTPYIGKMWLAVSGPASGFSVLMDDFTLNGQTASKVLQAAQHTCPGLPGF